MFIEGRLASLATDINEILYLYLTFLVEPSVSDIQTVAPTCPYFVGGGGGVSKIRACPYFGKCRNLRMVRL